MASLRELVEQLQVAQDANNNAVTEQVAAIVSQHRAEKRVEVALNALSVAQQEVDHARNAADQAVNHKGDISRERENSNSNVMALLDQIAINPLVQSEIPVPEVEVPTVD